MSDADQAAIRALQRMLDDADAYRDECVAAERERAAKAAGDYLRDMFDQPGFAAEVERAIRIGWRRGDGPNDMSLPERKIR